MHEHKSVLIDHERGRLAMRMVAASLYRQGMVFFISSCSDRPQSCKLAFPTESVCVEVVLLLLFFLYYIRKKYTNLYQTKNI